MVENNSLRYEEDIGKILNRAVKLFKETGLTDLAEKWQKVLKNYERKMSLT